MEKELARWMNQFVRVRLIQCNSVDLNLFHFDYDLTFAAFFLNADKTLYGRYGTRSSHDEAEKDVSIEGFAKAMEKALALHRAYPGNRTALEGKKAPYSEFAIPQDYPHLEGRFQPWLDFEGKVAASCIHCHMVRDADRRYRRHQGSPLGDKAIYPWPMPQVLGLHLDPKEIATVGRVEEGSAAEAAGLRVDDQILTMAGQPIVSIADVQWVLHQAQEPSSIAMTLQRGPDVLSRSLILARGWRRDSDISWRTTSWDLRRMAAGGLKMRHLRTDERREHGLKERQTALLVEHVGQYNDHAVAKKAGFLKGDIVISFDGKEDLLTETDVFAYVMRERPKDSIVAVRILRKGQEQTLRFKLQ